ncbi:PDDEXK nuclease domain-containing protein [Pontibacter sp. HSC-14F20]|uniref:PDDEXK nuclease domain-containing protein n=1 Tax=Pontibacter sp. HSC-14F20 TaxID=2864136 RepID=UPI0021056E2F|nr:PDDEXK nuclease domain-containing protein [Pontibacter sp. HSC-14F20]
MPIEIIIKQDLLFYHLKLRCYVVIELKKGRLLPEYAGKLNFSLSVVDDKPSWL